MGQENYQAEKIWLEAYFDYCDHIDLSVEAEMSMNGKGVTLPELLFVFRSPEVTWAERNHEGCVFIVQGRNCDDEKITIYGGFIAEMQIVSVFNVEKS